MTAAKAENSHETASPRPGEPGSGTPFPKGRSGNPGGRPKGIARRVREKLGPDGDVLVSLWEAMISGYVVSVNPATQAREHEKVSVSDRIAASKLLAERGWGKPPQFAPIEDDDPLDLADRAATDAAAAMDKKIDEVAEQRRKREAAEPSARAEGE